MKFKFKNALAYMPFLYYYIGPAAFGSYLLAGRSYAHRFSLGGWIFFLCFTAYALQMFYANGIMDGLHIIRFFWGFLFCYLIFKSGIQLQVNKLLLFLAALTILEAILVNTIVAASSLPNYPSIESATTHFAAPGNYQRPYSFGGSPSVTSVVLVALLSISTLKWRGKLMVVSAVLVSMSGSGFLALAIYFLDHESRTKQLLFAAATLTAFLGSLSNKFSADYLSYLFEYKLTQASIQLQDFPLLFGMPSGDMGGESSTLALGGDFAILSFLQLNGLIGVLLLLVFVLPKLNNMNRTPLLIMLILSFHYGIIYYFPGQLVFGYLLGLEEQSPPDTCRMKPV